MCCHVPVKVVDDDGAKGLFAMLGTDRFDLGVNVSESTVERVSSMAHTFSSCSGMS